jgi:hypothetical protein
VIYQRIDSVKAILLISSGTLAEWFGVGDTRAFANGDYQVGFHVGQLRHCAAGPMNFNHLGFGEVALDCTQTTEPMPSRLERVPTILMRRA